MRRKRRNPDPDPQTPLCDLPAPTTAAGYGGARLGADGAVVMRWHTSIVDVDVVYPYRWPTPLPAVREPAIVATGRLPRTWEDMVNPAEARVVVVEPGTMSQFGPEVVEYTSDGTRESMWWTELSRALGRPVPYWPDQLQDVEVMLSWRPGDPPVEVSPVPSIDIDPLIRLASTLPADGPAWNALMFVVRQAQSAEPSTRELSKDFTSKPEVRAATEFPILPPRNLPPRIRVANLSEAERTTMSVGWQEILQRRDGLARAAVRAASTHDIVTSFFPYSVPVDLAPTNRCYTEIVHRLEPTPRTAGHERALFGHWFDAGNYEPMWDPATDTPALRLPHEEVRLMAPHGTLAPITEVILDEDGALWMRLSTGEVIPPVKNRFIDMKHGYRGGGTTSFGQFLEAWLKTDTPHARQIEGERCREPFAAIAKHPWPAGTTITRDQVRRVAAGEPAEQVIVRPE